MSTLEQRPAAVRKPKAVGGQHLGKDYSPQTKRQAAAILEVMAGVRTPAEAAQVLDLSVPRYYQIEAQDLRGLLAACAPRPKGRVRSSDNALSLLQRENQRLQRELDPQQALACAAQRAVGLTPPPAAPRKTGKKPRKQRVARALNVVARLQTAAAGDTTAMPTAAVIP